MYCFRVLLIYVHEHIFTGSIIELIYYLDCGMRNAACFRNFIILASLSPFLGLDVTSLYSNNRIYGQNLTVGLLI